MQLYISFTSSFILDLYEALIYMFLTVFRITASMKGDVFLTILAVDNEPVRLWELVELLRVTFPDDTVEYTHDPLMAGWFAFNKPVDMLITELDTRRMDGLELSAFIRRNNPDSRVYLIASQEEFDKYAIFDEDNISGRLVRPVTADALQGIAAHSRIGAAPEPPR